MFGGANTSGSSDSSNSVIHEEAKIASEDSTHDGADLITDSSDEVQHVGAIEPYHVQGEISNKICETNAIGPPGPDRIGGHYYYTWCPSAPKTKQKCAKTLGSRTGGSLYS